MFARHHSPLLLQISSTNALESYHRDIKMHCERKDGFLATFKALHEVFSRKIAKEERAAWEQQSRCLAEAEQYPELAKFPLVFQQLIVSEFNSAIEMLLSNEQHSTISQDNAKCGCMFYKKYLLPCKHMFLLDLVTTNGWFTQDVWRKFILYNQECGFDIYSSYEGRSVQDQVEPAGANNGDVLHFHSILEGFRDQFWRLKEVEDDQVMNRFLDALSSTLCSIQQR
jgi:hypothetical protein